jgi:magnesium chelatase subunit I
MVAQLKRVPHLFEHLGALAVRPGDPEAVVASAAEFILEGLHARKQIGRSDERGFIAPERPPESDLDIERLERLRRLKKQVN